MRERKGDLNAEVLRQIGKLYGSLRSGCLTTPHDWGCFNSEDLFHDTIIQVARENLPRMTDRELADHFRYRFGRVQFQDVKDINAEHRDDNLLF